MTAPDNPKRKTPAFWRVFLNAAGLLPDDPPL